MEKENIFFCGEEKTEKEKGEIIGQGKYIFLRREKEKEESIWRKKIFLRSNIFLIFLPRRIFWIFVIFVTCDICNMYNMCVIYL